MARRRSRSGCLSAVGFGVFLALVLAQLFGPVDEHVRPTGDAGADKGVTRAPADAPAPAPAPANKPRHRNPKAALAPDSPWASPGACEAALAARPARSARTQARIGTWNLGWFPDGVAHGPDSDHARDVAWLACIIAWLDVDVLAVQEVVSHARGRAALLDLEHALDRHTGGKHESVLDGCPDDGRQHVGFLYDTRRVSAAHVQTLRELNPGRSACDMQLRPGLSVEFRWTSGLDLRAIVLHQDSGVLERDYTHRKLSVEHLRALLESPRTRPDEDVLVLGDWNTMGCERCAEPVAGAAELAALDQALASMTRVAPTYACSEYYKGHGSQLDHIFVTRATRELEASARVETHGVCGELQCAASAGVSRLSAFMHLSDHCPLVLALDARDLD